MSSIIVKGNGGFLRTNKMLNNMLTAVEYLDLNKYGKQGVEALRQATPKDTGNTADSWHYLIVHDKKSKRYSISWYNDNIVDGWYNVAVLLQYGHATNNGGYVKGRDYINPALRPIFDKIAEEAWKEVITVT